MLRDSSYMGSLSLYSSSCLTTVETKSDETSSAASAFF